MHLSCIECSKAYGYKLPQVSPEAKAKAAEAKARGQDAFQRKDYQMAIDAYTQVFNTF